MTATFDSVVVGAGLAGATLAERLASVCNDRVLVIDRRPHVAGNAHDFVDEHGVLCHRYGPHAFHTRSERIVDYLSRFTSWRPYEHRVASLIDGHLVPFPINRGTLNQVYSLELTSDAEAEAFLRSRARSISDVRTSEDAVLSRVGQDMYERFFRGYTRKHWGIDPSALPASVCARIPVRTDVDDRYFTDWFQAMPVDGYTAMVQRMLDHPNIECWLGVEYSDVVADVSARRRLVYTGGIDDFFGRRFGRLSYRGLRFEFRNQPTPAGGLVQPVAQINYPDESVPWTRTTEFRHMTGQQHSSSTVATEYATSEGEPCYPIPVPANRELYRRYARLAQALRNVAFVGRLARYQYLNMDQVVGQALVAFSRLSGSSRRNPGPSIHRLAGRAPRSELAH